MYAVGLRRPTAAARQRDVSHASASRLKVPEDPRRDAQQVREVGPPVVRERVEPVSVDGLLVPQRVAGDRDAREQGEHDGGGRVAVRASGE
jgi:hypothetical protein